MKSPYTKIGTVTTSLLIAAFFLFPSKDISPDSILLADVQRKIDDQRSCLVTGSRMLSTKGDNPETINLTVNKYFSIDYGYVDQTFDEKGNILYTLALHHPSKVITVLFHQDKQFLRFPIPQKYHEKMNQITPIKLFQILFCDDNSKEIDPNAIDLTTLEGVKKKKINGVSVVGFEITALPENIKELGFERLPLFLDTQQTIGHIWLNPETLLPVQLDGEIELGKCILTNYKEMKLIEVNSFTNWNMKMDENFFIPEIPADYQLFGMPEMKTTAVMGTSTIVAAIPLILWGKKRRKKKDPS